MQKILMTLVAGLFALALTAGDAEAAKRLGGGKSAGMQRESVTQKQATPTQQNAAAPATAPQSAAAGAAAQPKRNWLGPLAGLAAGIGLAALLSHFGLGEGFANFLLIALAVLAVVFVVRLLFARKQAPQAAEPMQFAGVGGPALSPLPPSAALGAGSGAPLAAAPAAGSNLRSVPADFDSEGFLRIAKVNFVRLQAANDSGNVADLREFLAPELFAEVKMQIDERGVEQQLTDVVSLHAELLEVVTEVDRHVASVRFQGMIREDNNGVAAPFDEVWNLVKPADGSRGWQVAGIQQLS